jgi:hypothetical protein
VLAILRERRPHRHAERLLADRHVHAECAQRPVQLGVERGDAEPVLEREALLAAVGRADPQRVPDHVEVDLERRAGAAHPSRGQAAHVDVQRDVPPVVARRGRRQAHFADDLAAEVQRVLRRAPVAERERRQAGRAHAGALTTKATSSS